MDGLVVVVDGRRLLWLVLGWAGLTQAAFRLFWITMDIVPGCPWKNKWAKQKKRKRSWICIVRPGLDSDTWKEKDSRAHAHE